MARRTTTRVYILVVIFFGKKVLSDGWILIFFFTAQKMMAGEKLIFFTRRWKWMFTIYSDVILTHSVPNSFYRDDFVEKWSSESLRKKKLKPRSKNSNHNPVQKSVGHRPVFHFRFSTNTEHRIARPETIAKLRRERMKRRMKMKKVKCDGGVRMKEIGNNAESETMARGVNERTKLE